MSRRGHARRRSWRSPQDVQPLERAFQSIVESAAGDPPAHATPLALAFSCTRAWSTWLRQVRERYPGLELPTLTSIPPTVLVSFQRPDGSGWLDAQLVDDLRRLACKSETGVGE
jgi:hypothetical protein